jgi:hypothetical protein
MRQDDVPQLTRLRPAAMRLLCWSAVLSAAIGAQQSATAGISGPDGRVAAQTVALTHVSVLNIENGAMSADVTVLVTGNRIAAEASDAGMRSIEHVYRHRMSCATAEDDLRRLLRSLIARRQAFDDRGYALADDSAFVLGLNGYSAEKCRTLGARVAKNGTWFVPTLVEMQTRFVADYPLSDEFKARLKDPRLRDVSPQRIVEWRTAMALDAGVVEGPFSFGPRDELALLVKGGLTPLGALQTATINPARFLGRDKELRTVTPGKLADLVLLDANPLEKIEHTTRIAAVALNGRYLSRSDLDALPDRAAGIVSQPARP